MQELEKELKLYKYCPNCRNKLVPQIIDNGERKKCNNCNFIFWNNPKPVVSVLLHKDRKVLMLQRANEPFKDYWVLPGGFIDYSENAEEAIRREAKEEIGADIIIDGTVGVYRIDNDPRGMHIDIIYYGRASTEITLSKEDKNWLYFSKEELPEKIAYKHRDAINDWYTKGSQYG